MTIANGINFKEITIVGGTHGNEFLGPYLIRKIENSGIYQNNALPVNTLLANPEAFNRGTRFIDKDLNRSFSRDILGSGEKLYEHQRARDIHSRLSNVKPFIIDLHSTTSNMGITLIVRNEKGLNLHAASYVQQNIPEARILISDVDVNENRSLNSISDFGLTVEVGSIPNAVVRQDLFEATEKVVDLLVRFLTLCQTREEPRLSPDVVAYKARERISYPRNRQGELTAMIHESLQDRDYRLLEPGQPVFKTFDNEELLYDGEPGHAVFINEAAYYREDVAFILTDRVTITVDR